MGAFAQGQVYVALSRATSFEGLYLNRPLSDDDVLTDSRIVAFMGRSLVGVVQDQLVEAIQDDESIQFIYRHQDDPEVWRACKPISLENYDHGGELYPVLKAYCYREKKERLFDCAKMSDIEVVDVEGL